MFYPLQAIDYTRIYTLSSRIPCSFCFLHHDVIYYIYSSLFGYINPASYNDASAFTFRHLLYGYKHCKDACSKYQCYDEGEEGCMSAVVVVVDEDVV